MENTIKQIITINFAPINFAPIKDYSFIAKQTMEYTLDLDFDSLFNSLVNDLASEIEEGGL